MVLSNLVRQGSQKGKADSGGLGPLCLPPVLRGPTCASAGPGGAFQVLGAGRELIQGRILWS